MKMYVVMYIVCFLATLVQLMALVIMGVKEDRFDREYGNAEAPEDPTKKDWIGYVFKSILISAFVSVAAPALLIFYIVLWAYIGITMLTEEEE